MGERELSQKDIDALLSGVGSGSASATLPIMDEFEDELGVGSVDNARQTLDAILDVPLSVSLELGRTQMTIERILALGSGSVVELNKLAGDPVEIMANGMPVARGEVIVLNDNFCVRITEILSPEARLNVLKQ